MKKREMGINVVSTLVRLRNQRFHLQNALLELIDNSIDANASTVKIYEIEKDLIIEDDGEGFDDIFKAFDIGGSEKVGKIGRYGVGLNDASVKYSSKTVIQSKNKAASCAWDDAIETGIADIIEEDATTDKTRVEWIGFKYKGQILTNDIRKCYALKLAKGLTISVNGVNLQPSPLPKFTDNFSVSFSFDDKKVTLTGGIFAPNDPNRNAWYGYNIYYQGRLLGAGNIVKRGVGDISCSNFSFIIELEDDKENWVLATNKDEVQGENELLDYIFHQYTRDILKEAEEKAIDVELRDVIESVQGAINGNITRSKRVNTDTRDDVMRPGKQKRNTFSANCDGQYNGSNKGVLINESTGLQFNFVELGDETLGEVMLANKMLISMNKSHPFVQEHARNIPVMKAFAILLYSAQKSGADFFKKELLDKALFSAGQHLLK